jgi:hypothetical protein
MADKLHMYRLAGHAPRQQASMSAATICAMRCASYQCLVSQYAPIFTLYCAAQLLACQASKFSTLARHAHPQQTCKRQCWHENGLSYPNRHVQVDAVLDMLPTGIVYCACSTHSVSVITAPGLQCPRRAAVYVISQQASSATRAQQTASALAIPFSPGSVPVPS